MREREARALDWCFWLVMVLGVARGVEAPGVDGGVDNLAGMSGFF